MKPLTLEIIRQTTAARPLTVPDRAAAPINVISTDTRNLPAGCLFIPLRGENFDGHDFIVQAIACGAAAVLTERPLPDGFKSSAAAVLQVDSTRAALGRLGRYVRKTLRGSVVAVAGSNGKTSTKYLIHAALSCKLRGSMSPRSFNNDIGVPLAIFAADPQHDFLVLEMGTNHPGEIRTLAQIGQPDIAVITNCGSEHLEFLGDLTGVRRENASIVESLNSLGMLVVNGDDVDLVAAVARYPGRRVTFGFNRSNDLFASDVAVDDAGVRFRLNGSRQEFFVPILGRHTACNALAAIAVGRRLGLNDSQIAQSLSTAAGPDMRLKLSIANGVRVLNDAYNANPDSMRASLETLAVLPTTGRRVAVLGDMRELGATAETHHRRLGEQAAAAKLDLLICVGEFADTIAAGAIAAHLPAGKIQKYLDARSAAEEICRLVGAGDLVLLKASRGVRLERVATAIQSAAAPAATP